MSPSPAPQTRAVHHARVDEIREVAPSHFKMTLFAPALAQLALPGQFVHILTAPNADFATFDPLLRRAFSIMSVNSVGNSSESTSLDILFRVGGRGTAALATARRGDQINLIGPLGKPFDISPFGQMESANQVFHVKHPSPNAILVGGGVGVPPLVCLAQFFAQRGIIASSVIGARNGCEVIGEEELKAACQRVEVTTDDGSRGYHGRVTDLLPALLAELTKDLEGREVKPIVYSCGPLPMLRVVAKMCEEADVRCQVSLEENMPCGIGVCNGCVVRARQPFAQVGSAGAEMRTLEEQVGNEWTPYHVYRRVCIEGPACWADEIDWDGDN